MALGFFDVRHRRVLPHPADAAYAWLTDYRDDDHERAGAIVTRRKVLKKEGNVVLLEGETLTLGRPGRGVAEVRLFPDELRWEAHVVQGASRGSVYEYRLTPLDPQRTRLDVRYRTRVRRLSRRLVLTLAKPWIKAEVARMWDGFAEAMGRELKPQG